MQLLRAFFQDANSSIKKHSQASKLELFSKKFITLKLTFKRLTFKKFAFTTVYGGKQFPPKILH